jgi:beta-galactosidase
MIEFPLRPVVDISPEWEFLRGKVGRKWLRGDGPTGEKVNLPHCWNSNDTYQYGVTSYRGRGGYRRAVRIPETDRSGTWYLVSDGFYGIGEVWLDGRLLTRFDGQYLGLDVPLPPGVGNQSHVLGVRLDNRYHRNVLPGKKNPDFLLYGGLVGGVRLELRPWPRIEDRSVEIACGREPSGSERIEIRCSVANPHRAAAGSRLIWEITTDDGDPVADAAPVPPATSTVAGLDVDEPRCWSPEDPRLYWAEGRLEDDSRVVDVFRLRFGISHAEFRPGSGFFLDGQRADLHGANRHESIPGLGSALSPELHRFDARLLKDYGANLVRLSHYPQHPEFLDACDELGIMVYPEIASWKSVSSRRGWRRAALRQLEALVRRDRHHPSVVIWGMGNESRARRTFLEMREAARRLDPDRPVTYAENHLYRARRQRTIGVPDVWGTNYELDALDRAADASRLGLVLLSECCNHPTSIRGDEAEELAQLAVIEREWEAMENRPQLIGHAVWSFTDYATEYRNRTRRQTGLFDAWRQPKMAGELFRARFSKQPFVSLFIVDSASGGTPSRFRIDVTDVANQDVGHRLHVFSNCDQVSLQQAGSAFAELEGAVHYVVPVDLAMGEISAVGSRGSRTACDRLAPWSDAVRVEVASLDEHDSATGIRALDIRIIDASGALVRDWNGHVLAVADGSATVHSYTRAGEILVTRGTGRVFVTPPLGDGTATVTVTAEGLETGCLRLGEQVR